MRFLTVLLMSLFVAFSAQAAKSKSKGKTPDHTPREESCPSYGCDDDSQDRGSSDSIDGVGSGYDGSFDGRGDSDGGGMAGELFGAKVQIRIDGQTILNCLVPESQVVDLEKCQAQE